MADPQDPNASTRRFTGADLGMAEGVTGRPQTGDIALPKDPRTRRDPKLPPPPVSLGDTMKSMSEGWSGLKKLTSGGRSPSGGGR